MEVGAWLNYDAFVMNNRVLEAKIDRLTERTAAVDSLDQSIAQDARVFVVRAAHMVKGFEQRRLQDSGSRGRRWGPGVVLPLPARQRALQLQVLFQLGDAAAAPLAAAAAAARPLDAAVRPLAAVGVPPRERARARPLLWETTQRNIKPNQSSK